MAENAAELALPEDELSGRVTAPYTGPERRAFPPPPARGPARWPLAVLPAAVALQLAASAGPGAVERVYSRTIYPAIGEAMGVLTGWLPFSVGEVLLTTAVGWLAWRLVRLAISLWRPVEGRRAALLRAARGAVVWGGGAYAAFLLCWGLNYSRQPLAVATGLDTRPPDRAELESLCEDLVREANVLRRALPEDARGVARLRDGISGALSRAAAGYDNAVALHHPLAGRFAPPKAVLFSPGLSYLGISGVFIPFTAEAHVNATLPHPDVPFTACHEMAHQRGYAREDEANYVGYLACRLHPDADFRYSAVLAGSVYALDELGDLDRRAFWRIDRRRDPGVRRDLRALGVWAMRHRGRTGSLSRIVNNAYLRAQGQPEGVSSYGRMIDFLVAERRRGERRP